MSSMKIDRIYWIISGAGVARSMQELRAELVRFELPVYVFLTAAAKRLVSPDDVWLQAGVTLVESWYDPLLMQDRRAGLTLVAPATFNTLNKLAHGIADTLPHSLAAEAIGAAWPMIVVPAMNPPLYYHPQVPRSITTLREWGMTVLEPTPTAEGERLHPPSATEIGLAIEKIMAFPNF